MRLSFFQRRNDLCYNVMVDVDQINCPVLLNLNRSQDFKDNRCIFRGGNSVKNVLFSLLKWGLLEKKRICSPREQILSFSGRPFF